MSDAETPAQSNFIQKTAESSNNSDNGRNNTRNSRNRDKVILTNPVNYEGETKGVGAVVGLRYEKFHKKLPFSQFVDKVYFYVISNYKHGGDLKPIFKNLEDPMSEFETKNMPSPIKNPTDIQKEIQKERVKQYVARETLLKSNMVQVYGLI